MSHDSVRNPEEYAIQRFQDIQNGTAYNRGTLEQPHAFRFAPSRTTDNTAEPDDVPLTRFESVMATWRELSDRRMGDDLRN